MKVTFDSGDNESDNSVDKEHDCILEIEKWCRKGTTLFNIK